MHHVEFLGRNRSRCGEAQACYAADNQQVTRISHRPSVSSDETKPAAALHKPPCSRRSILTPLNAPPVIPARRRTEPPPLLAPFRPHPCIFASARRSLSSRPSGAAEQRGYGNAAHSG